MNKLSLIVLGVTLFSLALSQGTETRFFAVGTDGTLECSWDNIDDPDDIELVKWTFKGKRLRGGKRYEESRDGNTHSLKIKNVQKKDRGTYMCIAKYDGDMILSEGRFIVDVDKARLPQSPEPRTVMMSEGGTGSLNCNYKEAKDRYGLKLFWTFNGDRLENGRVHRKSSAQYRSYEDEEGRDWLALSDLDMRAAGQYKCNYRYPDKQVFSMQFNVNVEEIQGPEDVVRDVDVNEDRYTKTLSCDLSGLSDAGIESFRWEKDGEVITNDTDDRFTMFEEGDDGMTKVLEINDLNAEDHTGVYRCIAELEYYPVALRFNLNVEASRKERDFADWSQWSSCDSNNKQYRFRTCVVDGCSDYYGYVYEVDSRSCDEDM